MQKNKKITVFLSILIFILSTFIIIYLKRPIINIKTTKIEINSSVNLYSLVSTTYGNIITKDYQIDTSKLGIKEINILVKTYFKTTNYKFNIEVVDTTKPVLNSNRVVKTTTNKEINLLKNVYAIDNHDENLEVIVVGQYDLKKEGTYNLKYYTKDSSNNETYNEFILIVSNTSDIYYITSQGYKLELIDDIAYIDNLIIANKSYSLPKTYGSSLTNDTLNNFNKMKQDSKKVGLNLIIQSGFRSYNTQVNVYNKWISLDGKEIADTYSARPGHSEHQTGLALDLNLIDNKFEETPEFAWLNDNCYKYGFILRYPKEKQHITGYIYEPWHYRYVGSELAKKLYNNGNWITLEEYFGIDSKYE